MAYEPLDCWESPPEASSVATDAEATDAELTNVAGTHLWHGVVRGRSAVALASIGFLSCMVSLSAPGAQFVSRLRAAAVMERFDLPHVDMMQKCIDGYKHVLGGSDPFEFQCPLPGIGKAMLALNKSAGTTAYCCKAYEALQWPYQFPECANEVHCKSCWVTSDNKGKHPVAPLSGLAWAASLAVYDDAKTKHGWLSSKIRSKVSGMFGKTFFGGPSIGETELRDGQIKSYLGRGLDAMEPNLCPSTDDWEQVMLNDHKNNVHARLLKSASKKLAVVAFRGTKMTSFKNWKVDTDVDKVDLQLGQGGPVSKVHQGFLESLERILPRVKMWSEGSIMDVGALPDDWTLLFTGHSLGGALATLAATVAWADGWERKPDAIIVFGSPRVGDSVLNQWWQKQSLCKRLLRVNTYNDGVHWMPFVIQGNVWWENAQYLMKCAADVDACMSKGSDSIMGGRGASPTFSHHWEHVCNDSEVLVASAVEGVNEDLSSELSPFGGGLAHMLDNCKYGYAYGLMRSQLTEYDPVCGVSTKICSGSAA